jgi:multicomponent Na+:H+ antiporter subunit C
MIEAHQLYAGVAVLLFAGGLRAMITDAHLLRKIVALNVMSSGVFLLLICIARRDAAEFPDPVPQAMVLTGIVVGLAVSALAMVLTRRIYRESGATTLHHAEAEPQNEETRK